MSSKDLKPLPIQDDLVIKLKEKRSQPPVSSYIKKKKCNDLFAGRSLVYSRTDSDQGT